MEFQQEYITRFQYIFNLRQKDLVLVPELTYLGQFSSILRSEGVRAEAITQYTGLPFKVSDLVAQVSDRASSINHKQKVSTR